MMSADGDQLKIFSKPVPQMPEGYYSGDKPNPNLMAFVEAHLKERPYDPETDDYDVPAFDKRIETTKATAIYNMHTYWSKKPHDAIQQYIRHYTQPGDLVLDPFCGSGSTALAALIEGRKAIAIDRSPAATFITKNYCTPVDVEKLKEAFEELKRKVMPEIDWLYETRCDRCSGKATTAYTVYSQTFQCSRCIQKVPLFDCIEVEGKTAKGKPKKVTACPFCYARGKVEEIRTRDERFGAMPVLVRYLCQNGCRPKRDDRRHNDSDLRKRKYFENCDLAKIHEIEEKGIPYRYPDRNLIEVIPYRMLYKKDFRVTDAKYLVDFYTKRNLWALASIKEALIKIAMPDATTPEAAIWISITSVALTGSRMLREEKRAIQSGTYYLPAVFREIMVINGIGYNFSQLIKAAEEINKLIPYRQSLIISTQSAEDLSSLSDSSVDYIFTDPSYGENVQYGELNFIWEAWLDFDTHWYDEEIIVNAVRGNIMYPKNWTTQ